MVPATAVMAPSGVVKSSSADMLVSSGSTTSPMPLSQAVTSLSADLPAWRWPTSGRLRLDWDLDLAPVQALCSQERSLLRSQLENHINTPLTSSMGRLFDAAAALAGVRQDVNYEGQAAIEFEALADPDETAAYPFSIDEDRISTAPLWEAMLADIHANTPPAILSARFHNGVAAIESLALPDDPKRN